MPGLPDVILSTSLSRLEEAWLEVRCCGASYQPLRMLARRYGGQHRVGEVVDRLRCRRCRGRPALVALVENPAGRAPGQAGAAPGWRVVLVKRLAAH
jgi:hypothetical protein